MVLALLTKKSFWVFLLLLIAIWIPYGLSKVLHISNEYISFFTNPFFVFSVILICMTIYLYRFFKPNWVSLVIVIGMIMGAFTYVYVFYMM